MQGWVYKSGSARIVIKNNCNLSFVFPCPREEQTASGSPKLEIITQPLNAKPFSHICGTDTC